MMPQQYQLAAFFLLPVCFLLLFPYLITIPLIPMGKVIRKATENFGNGVLRVWGKCFAVGKLV